MKLADPDCNHQTGNFREVDRDRFLHEEKKREKEGKREREEQRGEEEAVFVV